MERAQCYGQHSRLAGVEGKWKDFQGVVGTVAEESLQRRPQANKVWLQQDSKSTIYRERK